MFELLVFYIFDFFSWFDCLLWSCFYMCVVIVLGIMWLFDGLEVILVGVVVGVFK